MYLVKCCNECDRKFTSLQYGIVHRMVFRIYVRTDTAIHLYSKKCDESVVMWCQLHKLNISVAFSISMIIYFCTCRVWFYS